MLGSCLRLLGQDKYMEMLSDVYEARQAVQRRTGWRIEGTLREFPKFQPVNVWFDYPVHPLDTSGVLKDQQAEGDKTPWQRAMEARKPKEKKKKDRKIALENAYEACTFDGEVTLKSMAEYMGVTEKTVRNRIEEHGGYEIRNGKVKSKKT